MTDINWGLLGRPIDMAGVVNQGFNQGQQIGRRRVAEQAMGVLARDSSNVDALATLYQADPDTAARMETVGHERTKRQQDQNALAAQRNYVTARYGGGGGGGGAMPNALGPTDRTVPMTPKPSPGPTYYQRPPTATLDALAPAGAGPAMPPGMTMPAPVSASPAADPAWLAYAQADPAGAMKVRQDEAEWRSTQMKLTKADLEAHQAVNLAVGGMLGSVRDQATYDAAKASAAHLYERYGFEMPDVPDAYSPEVVQALQRRSLDVKDLIAADLNERKFDWQRQDDRIDNSRDDRRVNIQDRSARDASARGWRADQRSQTRFGERALDRAALAGVRSDTSDLDY
jgi:hypothetical protein